MKYFVLMALIFLSVTCGGLFASEEEYSNDDYLSQEAVNESIVDTLESLNRVYVYPDKAKEIQIEILKRMRKGLYSHIKSKEDFSSIIGADLRALSDDGHLSVMRVREGDGEPTHVMKETRDELKYNFAFQKVEVLDGNVGYIKINKFYQDEAAKVVVDHAFGFLENADAMIFDLRDCIGGSPELVRYVLSYFFKEKSLLWRVHERGDKVVYDHLSIEGLGSDRIKSNYPLYVLVGPNTGSAAELFSYTLKHLGKAKIVGGKTVGIAHLVGAEPINQYFYGRFSMARPSNPVTNDSWEGVGVIPNNASRMEEGLEVAHSEAIKSIALVKSKK